MLFLGFETAGTNPVSRLIAAHDEPFRYSHAALFFLSDDGRWMRFESHIDGGVRFAAVGPDDRFTQYPISLTPEQERTVREFCELHAGDGYDACGVLALGGVPFAKQADDKWFCSEIALAAIQQVGLFPGVAPSSVSPNALSRMLATE